MAKRKVKGADISDELAAICGGDDDLPLVCLPIPLALQILLQSSGYPLGKFTTIVGPTECYKSSLAAEFGRLHRVFDEGKGFLRYVDIEGKLVPELFRSFVGYGREGTKVTSGVEFLEDWQELVKNELAAFKTVLDEKLEVPRSRPICYVLDGLTSALPRSIGAKIDEKGHSELVQPQMANLINTWMKRFLHWFKRYPISIIGINHLKLDRDQHGNWSVRKLQGGAAPRFHESLEIEVQRAKRWEINRIKPREERGRRIKLKIEKNSFAPHGPDLEVEVLWYFQEKEGKRIQRSYFDWPSALVELIIEPPAGISAATKKLIASTVGLNPNISDRTVWSDVLGIPCESPVSYRQAGRLIESRPELVDKLLDPFGIRRRYQFQPARDFHTQMDESRQEDEVLTGDLYQVDKEDNLHGL